MCKKNVEICADVHGILYTLSPINNPYPLSPPLAQSLPT